MPSRFFTTRRPVLILFVCLYILISGYVMARFCAVSYMGDRYEKSTLVDMVQGTAWRPFVYRQLVPLTIKALVHAVPAELRVEINDMMSGSSWLRTPYFLHLALLVVVYGFLCGYAWALYKLAQLFYPQSEAMQLIVPAVGLFMVPSFSYPILYIYDFAVLCLSAACYYCMARQRWGWYLLWFFLACVNKETSIFLLVFYCLWFFRRMDRSTFLHYAALQALIYTVVKAVIMIHFSDNPGVVLEDHFLRQLEWLTTGYNFHKLAPDLMVVFLLAYRWDEKPAFARSVLWLFPPMLIAYVIFGYPGEYRVFFDFFPLLTLLVTHTLVLGTDIHKLPLFNRSQVDDYAKASVD